MKNNPFPMLLIQPFLYVRVKRKSEINRLNQQ